MPADIQYVLELVNAARYCADMEPILDLPKGKVADCSVCPIAQALPGDPDKKVVTQSEVLWATFPGDSLPERIAEAWASTCTKLVSRPDFEAEYVVDLPDELALWITEFDAGMTRWEMYVGD